MSIAPDLDIHTQVLEPDSNESVGDALHIVELDFTFKVICIEAAQSFDTALTVGFPK
jgi:hypothetical protein